MLNWFPTGLTIDQQALVEYGFEVLAEADQLVGGSADLPVWGRCDAPRDYGPSSARSSQLSRLDILRRLHRLANMRPSAGRLYVSALGRPDRAARLALRVARVCSVHTDLHSRVLPDLLIILGLAALGLQLQRQCELCFRLSLPFESRCPSHSQAQSVLGSSKLTRSKQAQAARSARLVVDALGWPNPRLCSRSGETVAPTAMDHGRLRLPSEERMRRAFTLAGALWNRVPDPELWSEFVSQALRRAPLVASQLPNSFCVHRFPDALCTIRAVVDPLEFDGWKWPSKITEAEEWFAAERRIAPGGPPRGRRASTIALRARLEALTVVGGLTQREAAERLGVSESYASKLLSFAL